MPVLQRAGYSTLVYQSQSYSSSSSSSSSTIWYERTCVPKLPLLQRLPKSQVQPETSNQWMLTICERVDSVESETRWTAPDHHIAVFQPKPSRMLSSHQPAKKKFCRQPERNRYDREFVRLLVSILMQGQFCAGLIAIDETGVRFEASETRSLRCPL